MPGRGPRAAARRDESPVARQILLLQVVVVVVLVVVAVSLAAYDARADNRETARQQALGVARSLADSPTVRDAVLGDDPSAVLQPYAEEVRRDTGTDFVVVMRLDRTRFTHPDPSLIGEEFIGDLGGAPEGRPFTQVYRGTLGPSVRAVVPVVVDDRVVALVAVGITVDRIDQAILGDLPSIALAALGTLLAGMLGAWLISRRLRRQTHGMGEREITRMYEYYRAVLGAVREGLLLVDEHDRASWSTTRRRDCSRCPATSSAVVWPSSACRPRSSRRCTRRRPRATTPTCSASGCSSSAPHRPTGVAATSAPSSPCATAPSCRP